MQPIHIIGSGLTGATIARLLNDHGYPVRVFERRRQVGGNVHDFMHASGIRVHSFGPHYFRTNSLAIWNYAQRFGRFFPYQAVVKSWVDGQFENWPVSAEYLQRSGLGQDHEQVRPNQSAMPISGAANFEEAALRLMPSVVYEKFVQPYTFKQWGIAPNLLAPQLAKRFAVHYDNDPRLTPRHRWQGIPMEGYAAWMKNMLAGIEVHLGIDYLTQSTELGPAAYTVFTGPIDAYFGFDWGRLHYRGQQREHVHLPELDWYQPCGQVNNPNLAEKHIRTLEWKHLMPKPSHGQIRGTLITRETPFNPIDVDYFEYPFPDVQNQKLYQRYRKRAQQTHHLLICGRLGEYRYYDMDQAIGRAMMLVKEHILPVLSANSGQKLPNLSYF